jgi:hypothetical protein
VCGKALDNLRDVSYIKDMRRAIRPGKVGIGGHIMSKLQATISHHSISRARVIDVSDDLTQAKRQASKEFGDEFLDYRIIIVNERGETIASRLVGEKRWS